MIDFCGPPSYPFIPGQDYKYGLPWIVCRLQELLAYMESNETWKNEHMTEFRALKDQVRLILKELEDLQNQIDSGHFPATALENWANANMERIIRSIVQYVMFGLTRDGYFIAYIPATWDFIQFDTIYDPKSDLFGHLVLRW